MHPALPGGFMCQGENYRKIQLCYEVFQDHYTRGPQWAIRSQRGKGIGGEQVASLWEEDGGASPQDGGLAGLLADSMYSKVIQML